MTKFEVIFNDGTFSRVVTAKNEDLALQKAINKLTKGQRDNFYNWEIVVGVQNK